MGRKIGEIFTYKGKTYKVVKAIYGCRGCAFFFKQTCVDIESCFAEDREDKTSIIFKEIESMEIKNNQLTIDIPKGMEIDTENSDFTKGIIKFKLDGNTYANIEKALNIENTSTSITVSKNNKHKLLAIDKLMNIARYYNKDWKPNPYSEGGIYYIRFNRLKNVFWVDFTYGVDINDIFFKNLEDAEAVVNNPNFKEILDTIYR